MRRIPMVAAVVFWCLAACGAAGEERAVGVVVAVRGEVRALRGGAGQSVGLKLKDEVYLHDEIVTAADAMVKILLHDEALLVLRPDSRLTVSEYEFTRKKRRTLLNLTRGTVRATLNRLGFEDDSFLLRTDNTLAGVRGTDFLIGRVSGSLTRVYVFEGTVEVIHPSFPEKVLVGAGYFTTVGDSSPSSPLRIEEGLRRQLDLETSIAEEKPESPRAFFDRTSPGSTHGAAGRAGDRVRAAGDSYNPQTQSRLGEEPLNPSTSTVLSPASVAAGQLRPAAPASPGSVPGSRKPASRPGANTGIFGE